MEPLTTNVTNQTLVLRNAANVQALLLSDDELIEESEDEVFKAKLMKKSITLMKKKLSLPHQTKTSLNHLMHIILNQTLTPLVLKLSRNMKCLATH
ncbi:hypothetical protein Tco_0315294 [Tanacetum coccineum]